MNRYIYIALIVLASFKLGMITGKILSDKNDTKTKEIAVLCDG